jgi:hypothetical protein
MKEFIQKNGDEVAVVIYDAPLPPKYFRLTKSFIRTIFVVVPVIFFSILALLFSWGLGSRLKNAPTPSLPNVASLSDSRIYGLEAEIKSLQESNKLLTEKLSQTSPTTNTEDPHLMNIIKPYGMQNLIEEKKVSLDQFEFIQESNKTNLKFQIISSTPENKVMGHVIVFMISESGVAAYPKETNQTIHLGMKYSSGEPFSVSRLRPTNAEFFSRPQGNEVKFVIYIFSREGDLLLIKETENYKVGTKS